VITDESSRQVTPLNEERAEPPAPGRGGEVLTAPAPERRPPWWLPWFDVAKAIVLWFVSIILLLLVPSIFILPYIVYRIIQFGAPSPEAIGSDKMLLFLSVVGILPTHLLTLIIVWMVVTEGGRRPFWKTIGFEWPQNLSPVATTLLSVLLAVLLFGVAWGVTKLYGDSKTDLDFLIESSIYTRIATAFVAVATAPLIEELIYRGVLYRALEKAGGAAVAIPIVSLLFAGVHVYQYRNNIAVIIVITLLSITLTVVRAITGKVLPAFIIHLVFNGIQSVLIVLGAFVKST
jgi:membrane protease YdiL (CAAX protease family)